MNPASARSTLIERSKREALLLAGPMIERSLQAGLDALAAAEQSARSIPRRMQLNEAWNSLSRHAPGLRAEFPALMLQAVEKSLAAEDTTAQPDAAPQQAEESILGLLDDIEVARFVEASRLQQTALPVVEHVLNALDSLISSAQGLPVVRADRNPFRPEILCDALLQQLRALPESDELRSHWLRHISGPFADELHQLYESLVRLLTNEGVEEARYRLKLPPNGHSGGSRGSGGTSGQTAPGSAGANAHAGTGHRAANGMVAPAAHRQHLLPSIRQLSQGQPAIHPGVMHDFLYRPQWVEAHDQSLDADYYNAVQDEMGRLAQQVEPAYDTPLRASQHQARQAQDVMLRERSALSVDHGLSPKLWGDLASAQARTRTLMQLKAKASRLSQVLGLDAVRLLINQVAADERILPPLREAFVALEPALLRSALANPRFFGDEHHPARLLMEAVAQRSFKYNDEYDPEFESFMEPVRALVHQLNKLPTAHPQDYKAHQERLQKSWEQQDRQEQKTREQVVGSMQFAEERQALADRIAWEFSLRSDLVGVPAVIADFLYRDWSLVLAHAQLTQPGSTLDPGGYLAVVSDLLWSVNRSLAIKEPTRLFELLPNLLQTLRRGLNVLGKEPEETQAFFDALLRFHTPVLRLRRMRSAHDIRTTGMAPLLDTGLAEELLPSDAVLAEVPKPHKAEQPWLGRHEREAAGFEESSAASLPTPLSDVLATPGALDLPFEPESDNTLEASAPPGSARQPAATEPAPPSDAPVASEQPQPLPEPAAVPEASTSAHLAGADTQPPQPQPEPASDTDPEALRQRIQAEITRLRKGDWADLYVQGIWRRAQLSWTSDNSALFMFISYGGRAHSMTRRSCEKLMSKGHLIPINIDPVVERALRQMASSTGPTPETQQTQWLDPSQISHP